MIKDYREMKIYQRSYEIALRIHEITKSFPESEKYDLTSQLRRCSKSIPSNIAEGWGRQSNEEFKRFLRISLGSCNEIQVHLSFSKDLKYILEQKYIEISKEYEEIGKMINVSIQKWNKTNKTNN